MPADEREYWTGQMEAADAFMRRVLDCEVAECGEPLVCLRTEAADAGAGVIFADGRHLDIFDRLFHIRASLAGPILCVAKALQQKDMTLRIEDAYRTPAAQSQVGASDYVIQRVLEKVRWELGGRMPSPELVFRRLAVWSATSPIFANHTAGSTIDVGVIAPDGSDLDMGAPYPELSVRTPMDSPFISAEATANRLMLRELFAAEGFVPYPYEFWHFSSGDADHAAITDSPAAARFGPVHWSDETGQITPVADLRKPLVTLEDIRPQLAELGCT